MIQHYATTTVVVVVVVVVLAEMLKLVVMRHCILSRTDEILLSSNY